jgi:RNA polymerase sigma-70 factor, ECF subfamily
VILSISLTSKQIFLPPLLKSDFISEVTQNWGKNCWPENCLLDCDSQSFTNRTYSLRDLYLEEHKMAEITQLLLRWSQGDQMALDHLMPLVYDELRRLAGGFLRHEIFQQTLQPTVLVHEVYLRMIGQDEVTWQNRAQFFGLASTLMRRILVDHTRERLAQKRGGAQYCLSLSQAEQIAHKPEVSLQALDDALHALAEIKPRHCRIVELRYFGGLTIGETAEVLGISHSTVERDWNFARAWLRRELSR